MVQTKSRPRRRTKGAGPERKPAPQAEAGDAVPADKYPNLAAQQEMDRIRHVQAAREMGATRQQASEHAAEEVGSH